MNRDDIQDMVEEALYLAPTDFAAAEKQLLELQFLARTHTASTEFTVQGTLSAFLDLGPNPTKLSRGAVCICESSLKM